MKKYLKLMRIKHYLKNILILLPIVFSGKLGDIRILTLFLMGFISFSLMSSTVYILNDIKDAEKDKKHPIKCNRPIASGQVKVSTAIILMIICLFVSIGLNYIAFKDNIFSYIILTSYLILNIIYSMGAKDVPLLDVTILVSGFLFRVIYGALICNVPISNWLYLTIISGSFYMGLGKRRNEIARNGNKSRKVLEVYNESFLDKNMYMCMALTIVFYSLWCIDAITIERLQTNLLIFTIPIIMLICMKYSMIIEGNSEGDPIDVIFSDKYLIGLMALYALVMVSIIYIKPIIFMGIR